MLRLEASRSGGIDIIDVLGRKRLDETNTKMYAIQALANASRSGTWDEQTLIALENSLFSQGRIYNNDTHTLSAADIDALITYEDGILFREFGYWLEGGGKYIVAGVTMIGMEYFVTHGADRIVDRLYPSNDSSTAYDILSNKTLTKHHKSTGTDNYVSPTKGNDAALKDFWSMNPNNVKTYPEGRIPYLNITPTGDMLTPNTCSHHFHIAALEVGLDGMRLHDLRHTVVTYMLDAGENPRTVQEFVGHTRIATTRAFNYFEVRGGAAELIREHVVKSGRDGDKSTTVQIANVAPLQAAVNRVGSIEAKCSTPKAVASPAGQQMRTALGKKEAMSATTPGPPPTISPAAKNAPFAVRFAIVACCLYAF